MDAWVGRSQSIGIAVGLKYTSSWLALKDARLLISSYNEVQVGGLVVRPRFRLNAVA